MKLQQWLQFLPADPLDPLSPTLIVALRDTNRKQDAQITGPAYANRPYAIIAPLPATLVTPRHGKGGVWTQLVDVVLLQNPAAPGVSPDPTAMNELWRRIGDEAPNVVTLHQTGHPLMKDSFSLETFVEPGDNPEQPHGLYGTLSFRQGFGT